jgi:hypothetical protein
MNSTLKVQILPSLQGWGLNHTRQTLYYGVQSLYSYSSFLLSVGLGFELVALHLQNRHLTF